MRDAESLDRLATPEEVLQACEALSDEDLYRLQKSASFCLLGSEYHDPDDIINEAICRTLHGERHWPKNVPFIAYLIQTMKGLGSDSRDSLHQSRTRQLDAITPEGGSIDELLGKLGQCHPDALTNIIEVEVDSERKGRAKSDADRIEAHFSQDPNVTWIILGLKEDLPATEIRSLGEMTLTQYDTAKRRFRRGVEKIFSEKRPS